MKRYLVLALAALAFAITAPSAFATRVIFDPPPDTSGNPPPPIGTGTDCTLTSGPFNDFSPCNINVLGQPFQVNFQPCGNIPGIDTQGFTWCMWMNNVTGVPVRNFTFTFTVPLTGGLGSGGSDLTCGSIPATVFTANCPQGPIGSGDVLTVSFFANPALPKRTDFYLFTDFENQPDFANVTVSVPEPGVLGMFGFGLLALGVGLGWQRRRWTFRYNQAA